MTILLCPGCGSTDPLNTDLCPGCGLLRTGPVAEELGRVDDQIRSLMSRRMLLLADLRRSHPGASPIPTLPRPARQRARTVNPSAQQVLLGLAVCALLAGAIAFVAATWSLIGLYGQAALMLVATTLSFGGAVLSERKSLRVAAESLALVAVGLVVIDEAAARSFDLMGVGGISGGWYWGGCLGIAAAVCLLAHRISPTIAVFLPSATAAALLGPWLLVTETQVVGLAPYSVSAAVVANAVVWQRLRTVGRADVGTLATVAVALGTVVDVAVTFGVAVGDVSTVARYAAFGLLVLPALAAIVSRRRLPERIRTAVPFAALGWLGVCAVVPAIDASPLTLVVSLCGAWGVAASCGAVLDRRWIREAVIVLAPVTIYVDGIAHAVNASGALSLRSLLTERAGVSGRHSEWVMSLPTTVMAMVALVALWRLRTWAPALVSLGVVAEVGALWTFFDLTDLHHASALAAVIAAVAAAINLECSRLLNRSSATQRSVLDVELVTFASIWALIGVQNGVSAGPGWLALTLVIDAVALLAYGLRCQHRRTPAFAVGIQLALGSYASLIDHLHLTEVGRSYGALGAATALAVVAVVAARRSARLSNLLEVECGGLFAAAGLLSITFAGSDAVNRAVVFAILGLCVLVWAASPGRMRGAYGAIVLFSLADLTLLRDLNVTVVEVYTLPMAAMLAGIGFMEWRKNPAAPTFVVLGPSVAMILGPTTERALTDGDPVRIAVSLALAITAVWVGFSRCLRAAVSEGAVVIALIAVVRGGPYLSYVPSWLLLTAGGAVLLFLGVRWELAIRSGRRAAAWYGALR